jgi:hypothetical protein
MVYGVARRSWSTPAGKPALRSRSLNANAYDVCTQSNRPQGPGTRQSAHELAISKHVRARRGRKSNQLVVFSHGGAPARCADVVCGRIGPAYTRCNRSVVSSTAGSGERVCNFTPTRKATAQRSRCADPCPNHGKRSKPLARDHASNTSSRQYSCLRGRDGSAVSPSFAAR